MSRDVDTNKVYIDIKKLEIGKTAGICDLWGDKMSEGKYRYYFEMLVEWPGGG